MENLIYPAIFHTEADGGYSVSFPDLPGCFTDGDNLAEAMFMAKDALGIYLFTLKEDNEPFPAATSPADIKLEPGEFTSLIEWDELDYLKRTDNRAVKKTLTIPSWLNNLAEREHINFSQTLQTALKKQLELSAT